MKKFVIVMFLFSPIVGFSNSQDYIQALPYNTEKLIDTTLNLNMDIFIPDHGPTELNHPWFIKGTYYSNYWAVLEEPSVLFDNPEDRYSTKQSARCVLFLYEDSNILGPQKVESVVHFTSIMKQRAAHGREQVVFRGETESVPRMRCWSSSKFDSEVLSTIFGDLATISYSE